MKGTISYRPIDDGGTYSVQFSNTSQLKKILFMLQNKPFEVTVSFNENEERGPNICEETGNIRDDEQKLVNEPNTRNSIGLSQDAKEVGNVTGKENGIRPAEARSYLFYDAGWNDNI